jgi:hypothetical protein
MQGDSGNSMRKQKFLFLSLVIGGLLFIVAAVLFFAQKQPGQPVLPTPLPPTQNIASSPTPLPPISGASGADTHPEIPRVPLEKAKAAFESKSAVFIDVRGVSDYALGHIPNALSIPLADIPTRLAELNPNQWIITYCT